MKVNVTFLQSGESPDFGVVTEGDEATMEKDTAELLKKRGVVAFVVDSNSELKTKNLKLLKEG